MDEFFDIEKDTETFTTALLTALILNGGKALTIKIKGKKTTVTAEAVEKCIDKDGNLDVEKLINNISPKSSLIEDYKSGKISLYGMADSDIDSAIQQKIYNRGWYSDTDYIYQYQYELTGSYGCDQGGIASLIKYKLADGTLIDSRNGKYYANSEKTASQEYHDIKNYLVKKYNMSAKDASSLLTGLDSIGACSYASTINSLISFYSTRPDEFEATFGYPLYKKNDMGMYVLNDKQLLAELYLFANEYNNGGQLFYTDANGQMHANYNAIERDLNGYVDNKAQECMLTAGSFNSKILSDFLKSKGAKYKIKSKDITTYKILIDNNGKKIATNSYTNKEMNNIIKNANKYMNKGYELELGIFYIDNARIRLINTENPNEVITTHDWGEGEGHAVKITGIASDGFIVSSWGERMFIPYEDLQDSGAFSIFAVQLK